MNIKLALKHIQNTSIVAFVLLSFLSPNYTIAQKNERPNIVLILTDQHKADAIGFVGKHPVKTPNLDKLAKSGIRFDNAYVTFPLCTPSRSSMFTGKMPHNLGVNSNKEGDNHLNPGEKEHVIGNVLSHVGYDCAYGGKWHAHEHSMVTGNGFEFIAPMGDIGLAEKSIEYINAKKKTENPFFLVVSFDNPHNICEWARDEPLPYGNIPAVELAKTPQLPVNFKKSKDFPEVLTWEQEANKKVYPTAHYSEADWRQYLYAYYQLVEKVDVEIGKIIDAIDAAGIRQNTLILFTSDHGDGNAAHGWNQKTALFQETTKVPFIVSYPGTIKKSKKANSALISNGIDLYPTICDYADVLVNETLPGESLKSLFEGKLKRNEARFCGCRNKV